LSNKTIDKYVNIIGQFWLKDNHDLSFPAQLEFIDSNYYLVGSMIKHDLIKEVDSQQHKSLNLTFYGLVDNIHISFFFCGLKQSSYNVRVDIENFEPNFSATFSFDEILVGEAFITYETKVSAALVQFEKLEEFVKERICQFDPQKGLLFKEIRQLKYDTKEYNIEFIPGLSYTSTLQKEEFNLSVSTRFNFPEAVSIETARTHIAHFRMLISMLKLHHIDICNIELHIKWDDNPEKDFQPENIFYYYLNHMPQGITELYPVPTFCLRFDDISSDFGKILDNWFGFLKDAEPIVEMFYQILINKSHDINLLLNLVQAMEVFSNRFRKEEVKQVLLEHPRTPQICSYSKLPCQNSKNMTATTWHKIYDLINYVNPCFNFEKSDIEIIASWIVDTRNYYTHYGRKTKNTLVQFEERGTINRLMRYLLTILIYNKLGINMELIADKFYHPFYKSTLKQVRDMLS
jgi:hypothetical protein